MRCPGGRRVQAGGCWRCCASPWRSPCFTWQGICAAIRFLLAKHRLVVEGSGAVGVAALLAGRLPANAGRLGIVLSGGNLDYDLLKAIVNETESNLEI